MSARPETGTQASQHTRSKRSTRRVVQGDRDRSVTNQATSRSDNCQRTSTGQRERRSRVLFAAELAFEFFFRLGCLRTWRRIACQAESLTPKSLRTSKALLLCLRLYHDNILAIARLGVSDTSLVSATLDLSSSGTLCACFSTRSSLRRHCANLLSASLRIINLAGPIHLAVLPRIAASHSRRHRITIPQLYYLAA